MSLKGNKLYEFEDFQINLSEQTLWFEEDRIPLAPKVLKTLIVLLENQNRLMTKDELMDEIWADTFVEERNLTQNIFTLRKLFKEKKPEIEFIETIPRKGYRFVAKVSPIEITLEDSLAVSHKKQLHITAEGTASKKQITEALGSYVREMNPSENSEKIHYGQLEPTQRKTFVSGKFRWILTVAVLLAATLGFWTWQNAYPDEVNSSIENQGQFNLKFERLTDSGNAFFPAISPDEQFVAYVVNENDKFNIKLQHLATKSVTEILPPKEYEIRSLQFSADGHHLYYAAFHKEFSSLTIYQIPVFGGAQRKIIDGVSQNFTISPDGLKLAFFQDDLDRSQNHLVVSNIDGSDRKIVSTLGGKQAFMVWGAFPAWSPDSKKIVAVARNRLSKDDSNPNSYLVEIELKSGKLERLKAPAWDLPYQAYWLSDGSGLIVLALDKSNDFFKLYHLSYPDGKATKITNDTNNYTEFRLSNHSNTIIVSEEKNPYNLELISVEEPNNIRRLTDSTAIRYGVEGLDWTPDGKELVYLKFEGLTAANIWKINTETLETKQITFDKGIKNRYPRITPDGRSIVFSSNRNGKWHVWQLDIDGSNLKQLTDGEEGEIYPQVSSDGKWLVYATPHIIPNTLWKKPLNGGKPVVILKGAGGISAISPDTKNIVAHFYDSNEKEKNPWQYVLLPFEAGHKPIKTEFYGQHHVLSWKPDNSGIYYLSHGQSHTDIWFYSLEDKTSHAVTDFNSREIINMKVSPDGKTFAVSRGKKTSNIFIIRNFL